jgi:hypothetical protein
MWLSCSVGRSGAKNVMVMLAYHTEITARHKDKAILYWFGPRVKPYVQFFGLYCWRGEITWRPVPGRTPLPALYWVTDKVGRPESKSVITEKPMSSQLQHGKTYPSCLNPSGQGRLGNLLEGL